MPHGLPSVRESYPDLDAIEIRLCWVAELNFTIPSKSCGVNLLHEVSLILMSKHSLSISYALIDWGLRPPSAGRGAGESSRTATGRRPPYTTFTPAQPRTQTYAGPLSGTLVRSSNHIQKLAAP